MKVTDVFIARPVLATCLNLLILVAGLYAFLSLNVRQYPRSDIAVVKVTTAYVGASADLVRGFVTTPLERAIASAEGIDYLESSSALGLSTINAYLRLNFDVNAALTQIQSKIAQVRNELPQESEDPVTNVETSDNRFASMYLSFFSEDLDQNQITDYLTRVVQPQLTAIKGVQKADILGARVFAMRVWLKPEKMAALNISSSEVSEALRRNNFLAPIGTTKGQMVSVNLVANTDLQNAEDFRRLVVREKDGSVIRLGDVANVFLGAESYEEDVRFDGQKATFMGVWVLPTANSLDVIQAVRDLMPKIQNNLPAGMQAGIPYDATEYINDALHEVFKTLLETILIVIVVIFVFIGSLRSVLVPIVAIPLSLIGALAIMAAFGFTINLLTLLAIVLSVGLVVDDAIVVLENIERHVEEGLPPLRAAVQGARELVGPIVAMTLTLAAVYAPIGLQGGLTGALFREFAFTLAGAVLISGIVALTLSPMMSSRLVRKDTVHNPFKDKVEFLFGKLKDFYERVLNRSLKYGTQVILAAILLVLMLPIFFSMSTHELAPREDQGVVFGILQGSPNSSLEQTLLYAHRVHTMFETFPEMAHTFQITMATGGFSGMVTKPWGQRSRSTADLEGEAWGKAAALPGIRLIVVTPPPLPGGSDFPIELIISSTAEPLQILDFANKLVQNGFQSGLFSFVDTDLKIDQPQVRLELDRDKVASLGLDMAQVGADLAVFLGGDYINRFSVQGRSYKVIPQAQRANRLAAEQIKDLYVSGPKGQVLPVSTFVELKKEIAPRTLNRFQQLNSAKIQGAPNWGVSINAALSYLEQQAKQVLPAGYVVDYAGESRQLRKEGGALMTTLFLAFIFIFLVLAAQFESWRDPFIILLGSVPLALTGAMIFPFLGATSVNIYSQVGLITLVGLVSKNGVLIVEFANKLQESGLSKIDAIRQAALTRLRPVLMVSVATVIGHFPLVLAEGAGAGARNSIGAVLVSGMSIGTFFTLVVLPCIYMLIAKDRQGQTSAEMKNVVGL